MKTPTIIVLALAAMLAHAHAQSVFINELHYDNVSNDENEGVEIAGPAGTDLSAYKIVFYNGANGSSYAELPLGGVIPSQNGTAFGTAFFAQSGIQNGAPDGLALIDTIANSVVQFLSYEGSFTAVGGDADGEISDDIGVSETGSTSPNDSLQLTGSGAVYSDFTWQSPDTASPGMINSGQTFIGAGNPTITLTLMPSTLVEGSTSTATLSLFPNPADPVVVSIQNSDPGELNAPASVTVPVSGSLTFTVSAIDDQINDGTQSVTLTASAPLYDPGSATALVQDIQRPVRGTAVRLATVNSFNGVGARNSAEYNALIALIERIEPDIIAFQELSSSGDFFDLRDLLADLGFPHLATTDDNFLGQAYEGGEFTSNQNVAIASRYPITSAKQIERGETQRKEMTRYPLMVEIDVPGTSNDPVVVVVHYKASSDDASRYRKAVEAYRTLAAIAAAGHSSTADNVFILGDFNEDHDRFMPSSYTLADTSFGDGTSLPVTYVLGSDIANLTIPYAQFPDKLFGDSDFITPQHRHQDGIGQRTFINLGDAALDYIIHSQRTNANGRVRTEIYNSALDLAYDGLVKQASPAPPSTSFAASDHFAVFGDYELDPQASLTLTINPTSLNEDAGKAAATGTLTLAQSSTSTVTIELLPARPDAPVHLPVTSLRFAPGETQKTFPIDIVDRPSAAPDRSVTIYASADGYATANDSLIVYNLEPSGRILISQYTEPPSGTAPRGIEVFNCSSQPINLQAEPIRIVQYTNGSTSGNVEAIAERGIFPAGGVVVIGDVVVGNYLVDQGILINPAPPITGADNGTPYLNGSGELVYVKEFFPYNGNDALEVQFAYGLSDVFGSIGQDPGNAWQSNGVSTANRNLALLGDVANPSAGFTRPHLRFSDVGTGSDLTGFGQPPAANDPFKAWLLDFGLTDPQADPDSDGIANLLEYATGSDPTRASSGRPPMITGSTFSYRQLVSPGRLTYLIESSTDIQTWASANLSQVGATSNGDGTSTLSYSFPVATPRTFLRLRVTLE